MTDKRTDFQKAVETAHQVQYISLATEYNILVSGPLEEDLFED